MSIEDLQVHVDAILDVLSKDLEKMIDREEVEKELKKFLEYGVPLDQAKQTLIKKFGGSEVASSERIIINKLQPDESSVNLLCRVITINPKEITVKGEQKNIFYGIFGDESGTIPFTAWKDFDIEKGDVLKISNAYTREWQGMVQVNLGDRVKIEKTSEDELPDSVFEPKAYKVKDLRSGLGAVEATVRVLDVSEREPEVSGEKKKVFFGIIGDETGKAQFTSWHDFKLKKGDVVNISGGYIKSWKGIPQLTFDERAKVKKIDGAKIPEDLVQRQKMLLFQLVERRGALDVEVEGTIIEIREGSGFIKRCPECNRVLQDEECKIHGNVPGKSDLRIKIVIDDGTGSVGGIVGRELTEQLLGKPLEELERDMGKRKDESTLVDEIATMLVARRIRVSGNALGDEFGTTIIVKDLKLIDVNIEDEASRLHQELEALR